MTAFQCMPASRTEHDDNFLRPLIDRLAHAKRAGRPWVEAWAHARSVHRPPSGWPLPFLESVCQAAYLDAPFLAAGSALTPESDSPRVAQVHQSAPRGTGRCSCGSGDGCDKPAKRGSRFCAAHLKVLHRVRDALGERDSREYRIYGTNEALDEAA